jgi:hypothetical protein
MAHDELNFIGALLLAAAMVLIVLFIAFVGIAHTSLSPSTLKAALLNDFANIVYEQALQGSYKNAGLPARLAQLVAAQSQHETGNYTSNVFKHSNNGFGYGAIAYSDYQTGSYEGFGAYASLQDSTQEIVDYIYRRLADGSFPALETITTPLQYATLLKNVPSPGAYYGDSVANYASGISRYFSLDAFPDLPGPGAADSGSAIIVLALGIGLYYLFS